MVNRTTHLFQESISKRLYAELERPKVGQLVQSRHFLGHQRLVDRFALAIRRFHCVTSVRRAPLASYTLTIRTYPVQKLEKHTVNFAFEFWLEGICRVSKGGSRIGRRVARPGPHPLRRRLAGDDDTAERHVGDMLLFHMAVALVRVIVRVV